MKELNYINTQETKEWHVIGETRKLRNSLRRGIQKHLKTSVQLREKINDKYKSANLYGGLAENYRSHPSIQKIIYTKDQENENLLGGKIFK